ncbi:MAG TPA: hypothetical protein VFJ58_01045 [Armatimonadota bacterium]|nr:hypothetical protein [Armatimonadota bacterium]
MTSINVLAACFPTVGAILVLIWLAYRIGLFEDPRQAACLPLLAENRARALRGDRPESSPSSKSAPPPAASTRRIRPRWALTALLLVAIIGVGEAVGSAIWAEVASRPAPQWVNDAQNAGL